MSSDDKIQILKELLNKEILSLIKASQRLQKTFAKAQQLSIDDNMDDDSLDICEALVSRFSRLSDFLVKKVLRLISEIELADPQSMIDLLNYAEKQNIIKTNFSYRDIRELRNKIVHEYEDSEFLAIIKETIRQTPLLLETSKQVVDYCQSKH